MINGRARKQLFIYIIAMVLLIFFSKTIYNYSLPTVTSVQMTSGALTKTLETYGTLEYLKSYDVFAAQSGRVANIYAETGARLEAFSNIARIEEVNEQSGIEQAELELKGLELSLARLISEKNEAEADTAAQTELDFRRIDAEISVLEEDIANKENEAEDAYALYQAGGISADMYEGAAAAVDDARNSLLMKNIERDEMIKAEEEKIQEESAAKDEAIKNIDGGIDELRFNILLAEAELERLKTLQTETITSKEEAGVLTEIYVQEGEFVAVGSRIATVALSDENFKLEITQSQESASFINIGDRAVFEYASETANAAVAKIESDGDNLKIELTVEGENFNSGDYGKVTLSKVTPVYEMIVPNEAILRNGAASEVWLLKPRRTALGLEMYVQKTKVFIKDQDADYSAISKGLTEWDTVVLNPPAGLENNERVLAE